MALLTFRRSLGPAGFGYNSTAEDVIRGLSLEGKTILVAGCTSGLGAETCRVLALSGVRVLGTARTREQTILACTKLPNEGIGYACELAGPISVRTCVNQIKRDGHRLDAIICNAGIMALPILEKAHGYELQFFTNHIGHFMLVTGLLDSLTDSGRVVILSSSAHAQAPSGGIQFDNLMGERSYSPWSSYGQSKLANLLFAKELQRRFGGSSRTAHAVHPGVIRTNLARNMGLTVQAILATLAPLLLKSIAQGAATQVFAAVHPNALPLEGQYLADCNAKKPSKEADDTALARDLWAMTEKIARSLAY